MATGRAATIVGVPGTHGAACAMVSAQSQDPGTFGFMDTDQCAELHLFLCAMVLLCAMVHAGKL